MRALAAFALAIVAVAAFTAPVAAQPTAAPSFTQLEETQVGRLQVGWSQPAGTVTGYHVRYSTTNNVEHSFATANQITVNDPNIRSFGITGLNVGTTYYLWVRAYNGDGNGPWSHTATAGQSVVLHGPLSGTIPASATTTGLTLTQTFTVTPATASCTETSARATLSQSGTTWTVTVTGARGSGPHDVAITCTTSGTNQISGTLRAFFDPTPSSITGLPSSASTTSGSWAQAFTVSPATTACTENSADAALTGTGATRTLTVTRTAGSGEHAVTVTCQTAGYTQAAQTVTVAFVTALAFAGDGKVDPVTSDAPGDAVGVIRDYGLENAPVIAAVIGAIFLIGLTFYLIRRGLMKARGAMRL